MYFLILLRLDNLMGFININNHVKQSLNII